MKSGVYVISVANLSVSEPVSAVRKFYWYKLASFEPAQLRSILDQIPNKVTSDAEWKKLVQDDPLIMPAHHASGTIEHLIWSRARFSHPIHKVIMKMQERQVKLRNQQMRVVPGVTDKSQSLLVSR
jgi:hypothetical protein